MTNSDDVDVQGPPDTLWWFNPTLAWWLTYLEATRKYRTRKEAIQVTNDEAVVDLEEMR